MKVPHSLNLIPLFETILGHIPAPEGDDEGGMQVLVSSIDYNEYVGRIAVGKINRGKASINAPVVVCKGESGAIMTADGFSAHS